MSQTRKDVLNGWKEIAAYLGRDPRTVERWEKQRSLPVRRLPGSGRATVYALVADLDAWLASSPPREAELPRAAETTKETGQSSPDIGVPAETVVSPDQTIGFGLEQGSGVAPPARGAGPSSGKVFWRQRAPWALLTGALVLVASVTWLTVRRTQLLVSARATGVPAVKARAHNLVPSSPIAGVEQLYMRGCYQTEQRTPESLRRAQDAFLSAISKDPHYAPAYAGLASTYILLREYATVPDAEAYEQARKAAAEALARDPDLPQAHAVLAFVDFFWEWNARDAEREFQTAARLDPQLALSHHWYGSMLTHEGRFEAGMRELDEAQRLEPSSAAILTTRALALGLGGHRNDGADLLQEALSSDKAGRYRNPATMHSVLGLLSLLPPRDIPRYLSETMIAAELRQDSATVQAMHMAEDVYRRRGEAAMWQTLLDDEQRRHHSGGPTYAMARYEAETGARDQALNDLADLYSRHDPALIGLTIDPLLIPLRSDPRFGQLRSAMGLPASAQN